MKSRIFFSIIYVLILMSSCKSVNTYSYSAFHNCIKNSHLHKDEKDAIENNFYEVSNLIEKQLINEKILTGIEKDAYLKFVKGVNSKASLARVKRLFNESKSKDAFYNSFTLYNQIKLCFRKFYFKTKSDEVKKEIDNYFRITDEMEKLKTKQNSLLQNLINNFGDNFYKNSKNRAIIIHNIYFIYHNFDEDEIL